MVFSEMLHHSPCYGTTGVKMMSPVMEHEWTSVGYHVKSFNTVKKTDEFGLLLFFVGACGGGER